MLEQFLGPPLAHKVADAIQIALSLAAVISPIGAVPVFLELTRDHPEMRSKVALRAAIVVAAVLLATALAGELILRLFNVKIAYVSIVGGGMILGLGRAMTKGDSLVSTQPEAKYAVEEERDAQNPKSGQRINPSSQDRLMIHAAVPLAMPILVGPGTIGLTITIAASGHQILLLPIIVVISLGIYVFLLMAGRFGNSRLFKPGIVMIISRIVGLLNMAIGAQMIVDGLAEALPAPIVKVIVAVKKILLTALRP